MFKRLLPGRNKPSVNSEPIPSATPTRRQPGELPQQKNRSRAYVQNGIWVFHEPIETKASGQITDKVHLDTDNGIYGVFSQRNGGLIADIRWNPETRMPQRVVIGGQKEPALERLSPTGNITMTDIYAYRDKIKSETTPQITFEETTDPFGKGVRRYRLPNPDPRASCVQDFQIGPLILSGLNIEIDIDPDSQNACGIYIRTEKM